MILYKYTADCSKLNLEQEKVQKKEGYEGLYPRRSDIAEWNSKFYTAYRTEKFFIMISDIRKDKMTIVAELEMEKWILGNVWIIFGRYRQKWSCLHVKTQVMSFTKKWSDRTE